MLFKVIDLDNSSTIEAEEFQMAQQRLADSSPVTPRMGDLSAVDINGDGRVDEHEWLHFMEGLLEVFGAEQFSSTVQSQIKTLAARKEFAHEVRILSKENAVYGVYTLKQKKPFPVYVCQNAGCELQRNEEGWQLYSYKLGDVLAFTKDTAERAEWIARSFDPPGMIEGIQIIDPNLPDMPTYRDKAEVWDLGDLQTPEIKWLPIRSLSLGRWRLFHGIGPQDLLQGQDQSNNCWVLSAIAAVAEFPSAIRRIFVTPEFNNQGMYELRLFNYLSQGWEKIVVDEHVPCLPADCTDTGYLPIAAQPNGFELWPVLLEKAFAKLFGGYPEVLQKQGNPCAAFRACTGQQDMLKLQKASEGWEVEHLEKNSLEFKPQSQWGPEILGANPELKVVGGGPEQLWQYLERADAQNFLMAASLGSDSTNERDDGLVENHTYTIISVVGNLPSHGSQGRRMVSLRNAMGGDQEWRGAWSDGDSMWDKKKEVRDFLRPEFKNDGVFWMSFEDFASIFDRIYVCAVNMKEAFEDDEIASKLDYKKTRPKPKSRKQGWTTDKPLVQADGRIFTGCADAKLRVINAATGVVEGEIPHDDWIYALACSPNNKPQVATAGRNGVIRIVDIDTGQNDLEIEVDYQLGVEKECPLALAWCGKKLACACPDGQLQLYDISTGMKIGSVPHGGMINSLALSPDKKHLISACQDSYCRIIDVVGGNVKESFKSNYGAATDNLADDSFSEAALTACTVSSTGLKIVLGDEEGLSKILDTPGVEQPKAPKGKAKAKKKPKKGKGVEAAAPPEEPPVKEHSNEGAVRVIACSPDGELFATGSDDGKLRVIHWETGKVETEVEHGAGVTSLAWGPGGAKVATACADGKLRLVDAKMGHTDFCITHGAPILSVAWMPGPAS